MTTDARNPLIDVTALYAAADDLGDQLAKLQSATGRLIVSAECGRRMRRRAMVNGETPGPDVAARLWQLFTEAAREAGR